MEDEKNEDEGLDESTSDLLDDYDLDDADMPELGSLTFDRQTFADVCRQFKLTQEQANGLWGIYTHKITEVHQKTQEELKAREETKEQMNKIEESLQKGGGLHLTKEEARILFDQMSTDMSHPYMNDKASSYAHSRAVALANRLLDIMAGKEVSLEGYVTDHLKEQRENLKNLHEMTTGSGDIDNRKSSYGQRAPEDAPTKKDDIGFGTKETSSGYGKRIEDALQ